MGYKRFNIAIPSLSGNTEPCESEFVSTVSSFEIGNNEKFESKTNSKKRKSKTYSFPMILRFTAASMVFIVLFSFMPLPRAFKNFLVMTVKEISLSEPEQTFLTEKTVSDAETSVKIISESENLPELTENIADIVYGQNTFNFSESEFSKIANETKYNIDIDAVLSEKYPIDALTISNDIKDGAINVFSSSMPEVLIIHTHGTECYVDGKADNFRTNDTNKNVVSVGRAFYEKLTQNGVSAIHLENMFDEISYINAYSNSYSAVKEHLDKYPSIKYVIDIHRDAASDENGTYEPMLFDQDTARMMFVVGTDEAGSGHTQWQKNLRTALGLQHTVSSEYPGLMRNLNLRRASFNQQLCEGYFILEVGNCGNTLEQAIKAAEIFADVFSKTV